MTALTGDGDTLRRILTLMETHGRARRGARQGGLSVSSMYRVRTAWRGAAADPSNAGFMRSMATVLDIGDALVRESRDGMHSEEFTDDDVARVLIAGGRGLANGRDAATVGESAILGLMERWMSIFHLPEQDPDDDTTWLLSGDHPRIFPLLPQAADIASRVPRGRITVGSMTWVNGPDPEQPVYTALALSLGMDPDATPDDMILVEWMKGRVYPDMLAAIRSIGGLDHAPDLPVLMLVHTRTASAFGPVMRDVALHRATHHTERPDSAMMHDILDEQIADIRDTNAYAMDPIWADSILIPHELRMTEGGLFPPSDIARESAYLRVSRLVSLLDSNHVRALVESGADPMIAPFSEAWGLLEEGMPEGFVVETLAGEVEDVARRGR